MRLWYIAPLTWTVASLLVLAVSIDYVRHGWSIPVQVLGVLIAVLSLLALYVGIFAIRKGRRLP